MTDLKNRIPRDRFLPLPRPTKTDGTPCRVGVEIELGGLDEDAAARVLTNALGGQVERDGTHTLRATGTDLGDMDVYLDTAYRERSDALIQKALDLAGDLVPVEIVTPPLSPDQLPRLEALQRALDRAGGTGSQAGPLLGYGIHFNPELPDLTHDTVLSVIRAFALLEDAIRAMDPIDLSRRVLPFVDPWPRKLVDALAGDPPGDLDALIGTYLDLSPSRNHALDPLCLFRVIDEDRITDALPDMKITARPTWHYRLPDCRIGDADWSLAYEWNRWVMVETLARDTAFIDSLAADWAGHRDGLTSFRGDWAEHVLERLAAHPLFDHAPA